MRLVTQYAQVPLFQSLPTSACMRDALIVCVHDSGVMSLLA